MPTFAIGDIHGRLDLLQELVELRLPLRNEDVLVFIGDYVDRGSDSAGVIEYLLGLMSRRKCVFLRGNHEDMFMSWLGLGEIGRSVSDRSWLAAHGGAATLASYGLPTRGMKARWKLNKMRGRPNWLQQNHAMFLTETVLQYEDEDAYYVHAGFKSGIPVSEQSPDDMLWIRQGWVDEQVVFDRPVVHGHTPTPYDGGKLDVRILPHRINIDTGCGKHPNGFLSAVRMPDLALFSVGDPRAKPYQLSSASLE